MLIFTSCTNNYIPKARVLAYSLKKFHPKWEFCLLLGETPPKQFNIKSEPFDRILLFSDLPIQAYHSWLFRPRVVEICTAAKGPALDYFITIEKQEKVIYLDPDIMVTNTLDPLDKLLDENDILLTPHQLAPQETYQSIIDNEICSLKHGIFNLGFVAVAGREQGCKFSQWWRDRLYLFCYDDISNGLFTDQRWCDMAPAYFSKLHIIRDPGYNAATWNLTDRYISETANGDFMANDSLLRFYHFTGYDSGAGETMASIYGRNMPAIKKLWDTYAEKLNQCGHSEFKKEKWKGMFFDDGTLITDDMRLVYRNNQNLQHKFPDPFHKSSSGDDYYTWYKRNKYFYKKIFKINHKISMAINLINHYLSQHGGIRYGLPRLIKKFFIIFTQQGFKGIINKFKIMKYDLNKKNIFNLCSIDTNKEFLSIKNKLTEQFTLEKEAICIIDHQYGGGAGKYSEKNIKKLKSVGKNILHITWDIFEKHINIAAHIKDETIYLSCKTLQDINKIDWLFFSKIILNELVTWNAVASDGKIENKYEIIPEILREIELLVEKKHASLEIMMHDYFPLCPSYTLLNNKDIFCDIPTEKQICHQCLLEKNIGILPSFDIGTWRSAWQNIFNISSCIVFFSRSSANIAKKVFSFHEEKIKISPHEPLTDWNGFKYNVPVNTPMTIGVIGTIEKHKGSQIIADLLPLLSENERIVIIGELEGVSIKSKKLTIHGAYRHDELPELLRKYNITIGLIPSIWPETFNFTSQECTLLDLPTVTFNLGAQGERIGNWGKGLLAKECTAQSAYEALHILDQMRK